MTRLEKIEFDALSYTGQPSLPKALSENDGLWYCAIAKIKTRLAVESYAIVRNEGNTYSIIKTFSEGGFAEVLSIHPYQYVSPISMPPYKDQEGLKKLIMKAYDVPAAKVKGLGEDKLMKLYNTYCLKLERRRLSEIKEKEKIIESRKLNKEDE